MGQLEARFGKVGAKGEAGEAYLFERLQRDFQVIDYRHDMIQQTQGIDFGIRKPEWRREYTLDVKNTLYIAPDDSFTSIKVELECKGKPGWFFTSKADRIYHTNAFMKRYLYYDLNELRHYITKKLLEQSPDFEIVHYNGDVLAQFRMFATKQCNYPISDIFV